jgi:anti-sigma factor RsiW
MDKQADSMTDADLVAFVDGRLSAERRQAITDLARKDSLLAQRIAVLTEGTPVLDEAFQPMLAGAPAALETRIRTLAGRGLAADHSPSRRWIIGGAALAASFAIGVFSAGLFADKTQQVDWREAVAQYHALYGKPTTARLNPSVDEREQELALVSQALGLPLANVWKAAEGYAYKRAQVLEFEGGPLIQIVFESPGKVPLAFCLKRSRSGAQSVVTENRLGMALASWTRNGVDELVVARLPADEIKALAERFNARSGG